MSLTTIFTLGPLLALTSAAEALTNSFRTLNISTDTSSQLSSITAAATSTPAPDAAALLATFYYTEAFGGEWNPYGPDPYGFPNNAPASINSYCSSLFMSSSSFFDGTVGFTSTSVPAYTLTAPSTTLPVEEVVYVYQSTAFSFKPSAPCCLNCTLFGGTVQVYDWPTPAPSPPVTKLVNSNDFTFVSPSVYVAFQSLRATDLCGSVGESYNSTTLAFAPGALMTAPEYFVGKPYYITDALNHSTLTTDTFVPPDESFTLASFGDNKGCKDITSVTKFSNQLLSFDPAMGGDGTQTITMKWNPCSPKVSMPTELFTINSMWTACLKGIDGLFDPPYTLTTGGGLSAFSATPTPVVATPQPQTTNPAVAGSTPAPMTPAETPTNPPQVVPTASPSPSPMAAISVNSPAAETPTTSNYQPAQSPTAPNDPPVQSDTPAADTPAQSPTAVNTPVQLPTTANNPPTQSPTPPNDSPAQSPSISPGPPTNPVTSIATPPPVVVASKTLMPGPAITHSSATYSLASNGATLVIANSQGTTTQLFATSAPFPSPVVVASQTLAPGSQIIHSSTTYSLARNGATLIVANSEGTSTQFLSKPTPPPQSSFIVIGSHTVSAGSSAIEVGGTHYSLATSGNVLVVDGTSQYLTGSQTLIPGSAITIAGTVVSLLPSGFSVVVASHTVALSEFTGTGVFGTTSEIEYVVGSQTIVPGGAATVTLSGSAVEVSLLAGGSSVVVGGTTTLPASALVGEGASITSVLVTEVGLGGIIASLGGFGLSGTSCVSASPYVVSHVSTGIGAFRTSISTGTSRSSTSTKTSGTSSGTNISSVTLNTSVVSRVSTSIGASNAPTQRGDGSSSFGKGGSAWWGLLLGVGTVGASLS